MTSKSQKLTLCDSTYLLLFFFLAMTGLCKTLFTNWCPIYKNVSVIGCLAKTNIFWIFWGKLDLSKQLCAEVVSLCSIFASWGFKQVATLIIFEKLPVNLSLINLSWLYGPLCESYIRPCLSSLLSIAMFETLDYCMYHWYVLSSLSNFVISVSKQHRCPVILLLDCKAHAPSSSI